jgi:hypothetical protein
MAARNVLANLIKHCPETTGFGHFLWLRVAVEEHAAEGTREESIPQGVTPMCDR